MANDPLYDYYKKKEDADKAKYGAVDSFAGGLAGSLRRMGQTVFGDGGLSDLNPNLANDLGINNQGWQDYYSQQAARGAPQSTFNSANSDQARQQQLQMMQQLHAAASGDPNSVAQQQLRASFDTARGQQMGLAAARRDSTAGAALRGGVRAQGDLMAQQQGASQMLMEQEKQAAMQRLQQAYEQQRGQDLQAEQLRGQLALQYRGLGDEMENFYTQSGIQDMLRNYQRNADLKRSQLGLDLEAQNLARQGTQNLINAGGTALATGLRAFGGQKSEDGGTRQRIEDAYNGV